MQAEVLTSEQRWPRAIVDGMERCRRRFDSLVAAACAEPDAEHRLCMIEEAARFSFSSGCGSYASSELEASAYEIARSVPCPEGGDPNRDTVLIVMSEAYLTGGHTRVVERWIEFDVRRRYSVLITRQPTSIPVAERLVASVRTSGGELILQDPAAPRLARACALRNYAIGFERIVLHTHMDDTIPLVAFGVDAFPRPVGYYNHSDHLFWLGVGLSDCVAELWKGGAEFSCRRRGIENSFILGIPAERPDMCLVDRCDARRSIGISESQQLIVTCATAYKFIPVSGHDILPAFERILSREKDAVIAVIGVCETDFPRWGKVSRRYGGRLRCVPPMPHEELVKWLCAADIALDSYPAGGATTLADALSCGIPVLSATNNHTDWTLESSARCGSLMEMADRAIALLHDENGRRTLQDAERCVWEKYTSQNGFLSRLEAFYARLNGRHLMRRFVIPREDFFQDDRWNYEFHSYFEVEEELFGGCVKAGHYVDPVGARRAVEVFGCRWFPPENGFLRRGWAKVKRFLVRSKMES